MSDLVSLERAAFSRAPDRVQVMIKALWSFILGTMIEDAAVPNAVFDRSSGTNRMVAALTAILADPEVSLTRDQIDNMLVMGGHIVRLFQASGFDGSDFLLKAAGGGAGISRSTLVKLLPCLAVDCSLQWPLSFLLELPPAIAQQTLAHLVSAKPVMTALGQNRRDALLDFASQLPPAEIRRSPDHIVLITGAWMLCSYAGTPRKHEIKRLYNDTLRRMAQGCEFNDIALSSPRELKSRPIMLFAAEIMHAFHVQYRYFGQYLRQLRTRFELVLLTAAPEVSDAVTSLFDRVLTFDRTKSSYLQDIHRMIVETAPDILFWPSVGMRHWGPLFANLRLAPIQLTALGHSASTFCETIDYYLLEEGYVSDPALFGETVVTVPDDSLIFERAPGYRPMPPDVRSDPPAVRLVMPSNILKLNPGFLATVAKIRARVRRPVELHFLPNAKDHELDVLRKTIRAIMPDARVHPQMPYQQYLETLNACDLNLSPFPFGGLHSVVDSLRQGIPVVAMECPEPHGRTDAMLLRRLGMPDWLIARDEEEYIAAAVRVIEDDGLRVALAEQALALDIDNLLFGDATTPLRSEIVDAVWWLYRNHEAARADGRKIWSQADRQAFAAA